MRVQNITLAVAIASAMGCTASGEKPSDEVARQAISTESVDASIDRNLQLMANIDTEEAWRASLEELRATPGVVDRVVAAYDEFSRSGSRSGPAFRTTVATNSTTQSDSLSIDAEQPSGAERRWLAVNLLGYLGREAITHLERIATTPLPETSVGEQAFAIEYRIRLRAIAGLGTLDAQRELQRLYAAGGLLRRAAASALTELGQPPPGFRIVDARSALAEERADFTDVNPNGRQTATSVKPPQAISRSLTESPR